MTKEEQKITIATACRWELRELVGVLSNQPKGVFAWFRKSQFEDYRPACMCGVHKNANEAARCLPDYLNDFNAMHEVVGTMPKSFQQLFDYNLRQLAERKNTLVVLLTAQEWVDIFVAIGHD